VRSFAAALLLLCLPAVADSIELSSGQVFSGKVRLTRKAVFKLTDAKAHRKYRIDPSEVASLEMRVVSEAMERPYTFKNPGDPTKTYSEGRYPVRNLACTLTRKDGRTISGDLISTIVYLRPKGAEDEVRFKLVRQQKGTVGQSLADLVYVRAIRWDGAEGAFIPATLRGRIDAPHPLEAIAAYRRESNLVYPGRVDKDNRFEIGGLPAGTYDLFAQTRNEFLHPLESGEDLAAVQEATGMASDFFEQRKVWALQGTRKASRALVLKVRTGKTSFERELQGAKLWRLEIWLWHAVGKEWRIDRRVLLFRGRKQPDQVARTVRRVASLGAITIRRGEDKSLDQ